MMPEAPLKSPVTSYMRCQCTAEVRCKSLLSGSKRSRIWCPRASYLSISWSKYTAIYAPLCPPTVYSLFHIKPKRKYARQPHARFTCVFMLFNYKYTARLCLAMPIRAHCAAFTCIAQNSMFHAACFTLGLTEVPGRQRGSSTPGAYRPRANALHAAKFICVQTHAHRAQ